jgi:uncharacterized membrane protein HdeD (DUF308 family)
MSTTELTSSIQESRTARLFLSRGLAAIAWAVVFAAASKSVGTTLTIGVGVLLVIYPLIDFVASMIDARSTHGSTHRLLLGNATVSLIAAIGLGVAATGTVSDVLAVFGIWAGVTGAAQLIVALRRRALLGNQWPMLLAGSVSVIGGISYVIAATGSDPKLRWLVIYTATGGVEFVIQAWLLLRRRHRIVGAAA